MTEKLPGEEEALEEKAKELKKKAETANSLMQEFAEDDTLGPFYQEKFQEYTEALKTIDARLQQIKAKKEETEETEQEETEEQEEKKEKKYRCEECDRTFNSKRGLKVHKSQKHQNGSEE